MVGMATRREETDLRLLRAVLVFVGVSVLCCGAAGARAVDGALERRGHKHRHTAGRLTSAQLNTRHKHAFRFNTLLTHK